VTVTSDGRLRIVAGLLVVAAVLFVIGVAAESDGDTHTDEPGGEAAEHPGAESGEAGESAEVRASEAAEGAEATEGDEERVLGLDLESPASVALALVLSGGLAAAVLWRPDRRVLVAIAVVAAAFAVLDIAEVSHQLDEDRTGLAVLAATIAAMHAATAALAVWHLTASSPTSRPVVGSAQ
jgi:hypothetical protein